MKKFLFCIIFVILLSSCTTTVSKITETVVSGSVIAIKYHQYTNGVIDTTTIYFSNGEVTTVKGYWNLNLCKYTFVLDSDNNIVSITLY